MALTQRSRTATLPAPFERAFFDWPVNPLVGLQQMLEDTQGVRVEEFTEDGNLVVKAELPGVDPEKDVDISVVDGNLQIRAERRQEERVDERDYRRSEIRYGSYARVIPLPANAKQEDIKASYKDGILEVRTPLVRKNGHSRIAISRRP